MIVELSLTVCVLAGVPECHEYNSNDRPYQSFEDCEAEGERLFNLSQYDLKEERFRILGFTCRLIEQLK